MNCMFVNWKVYKNIQSQTSLWDLSVPTSVKSQGDNGVDSKEDPPANLGASLQGRCHGGEEGLPGRVQRWPPVE